MKLKYTLAVVLCALAFSPSSTFAADFGFEHAPSNGTEVLSSGGSYGNGFFSGNASNAGLTQIDGLYSFSGNVYLTNTNVLVSNSGAILMDPGKTLYLNERPEGNLTGLGYMDSLEISSTSNSVLGDIYMNGFNKISFLRFGGNPLAGSVSFGSIGFYNTNTRIRIDILKNVICRASSLGVYYSDAAAQAAYFDLGGGIDFNINSSRGEPSLTLSSLELTTITLQSLQALQPFVLNFDLSNYTGGQPLFVVKDIDDNAKTNVKNAILANFDRLGVERPLSAEWTTDEYGVNYFNIVRADLPVPEPSTATLGLVGLSALLLRRRRMAV